MAYILAPKSPCWWYPAWVQHSCLCHHQHAHCFSSKDVMIFCVLRNMHLFSLSTAVFEVVFPVTTLPVFKNLQSSRSEANGTVIVQLSWSIEWSWPSSLPIFPPLIWPLQPGAEGPACAQCTAATTWWSSSIHIASTNTNFWCFCPRISVASPALELYLDSHCHFWWGNFCHLPQPPVKTPHTQLPQWVRADLQTCFFFLTGGVGGLQAQHCDWCKLNYPPRCFPSAAPILLSHTTSISHHSFQKSLRSRNYWNKSFSQCELKTLSILNSVLDCTFFNTVLILMEPHSYWASKRSDKVEPKEALPFWRVLPMSFLSYCIYLKPLKQF